MSLLEWTVILAFAWIVIGVVITAYALTRLLDEEQLATVQLAIIGESNMTRKTASRVIWVMGILIWPATAFFSFVEMRVKKTDLSSSMRLVNDPNDIDE